VFGGGDVLPVLGRRETSALRMAAGETGVCDLDKPCTYAILDDAVMAQYVCAGAATTHTCDSIT
jgi:hypothetical protein